MKKITLDEFDQKRWNKGEDHPNTKPWFWVNANLHSNGQWMRWLENNCHGDIFFSYDIYNDKGRIWFENSDDAMKYRLTWE